MSAPTVPPALLGLTWALLVLGLAWRLRPVPVRRPSSRPTVGDSVGPGGERRGVAATAGAAAVGVVGRMAARVTGRALAPEAATRLTVAAGAALLVLPAVPLAAPAVAGLAWVLTGFRRSRAATRRRAALARDLPEVVDLFVLAVSAGLNVPLALRAVAVRAPGPLAAELDRVGDEVALGRRTADALGDLPGRAGEACRPLVAALVASERYGAPLLDRLLRLADEVRADRRRRAEEAARRVPVKLLFPLVFCTLPAFALLTVAPLVAGALPGVGL